MPTGEARKAASEAVKALAASLIGETPEWRARANVASFMATVPSSGIGRPAAMLAKVVSWVAVKRAGTVAV